MTKNIVVFDILSPSYSSNKEKDINKLELNTSNLKKYSINFSTNDEDDVLTKLKDMSKKKRVLIKYFFNTDTNNYQGSVFIDVEENMIVHYYPSFFSKDLLDNILSFFMTFYKKDKKVIFEVYSEHHSTELIRYKKDEDESYPGKNYIKTLMGNINNKVRGTFYNRGEVFSSVLKTFYTDQQRVLLNNLLLRKLYRPGTLLDENNIIYWNRKPEFI